MLRHRIARLKSHHLFLLALIAGTAITVGYFAYAYAADHPALKAIKLSEYVAVAGQIETSQVKQIKLNGYKTIVDFRPDGEAAGQASSQEIEAESQRHGIRFIYLPVPHGDGVPEEVVTKLASVVDQPDGQPVLLYCRSGRRATRAWSLAEASRTQGMGDQEILRTAKAAGQSVDDLNAAITEKVRQRPIVVTTRSGESK
ncbi:TIGR01244 family sulfur transferase [Uliginosibacterium sp. TH139]|uniref:TIGR01244 family sulfur transferase n=1 Tax=Uliginosibacterium sp. TH139 TaxID=2067453 RepID=UPI000C7C1DEA|nr:TIGR01244 family sulfur transferase [Uliginosibacterium sp. TH139]PLK50355.1 TIGR01244 family phosphatase [Uliginosibacterium sp. TH139]